MKISSDKLKVDGWKGPIRLAPQVNSSNFKISRQKLRVLNPNIVVKGLHWEIRHLSTLLAFGKCLIAEFCFKQTTTQQK